MCPDGPRLLPMSVPHEALTAHRTGARPSGFDQSSGNGDGSSGAFAYIGNALHRG